MLYGIMFYNLYDKGKVPFKPTHPNKDHWSADGHIDMTKSTAISNLIINVFSTIVINI